jgi:MFS family permease
MNNPNHINGALRVAELIGTAKKVLIGLIVVAVGLSLLLGLASNDGNLIMMSLLFGVVGGGFYAVLTYVMFGWFEHTLRALVAIAQNTSRTSV